MQILNTCRLYLQVTTLSDIVSGDGYYILEHIFQRRNPLQSYSSIKWPNQGLPNDRAWNKWNAAIRQCFPTNRHRCLLEPLDKWREVDPKWGAYFNSTTTKFYIKAEQWMQFTPNTDEFFGEQPTVCVLRI